MKSVHVLILAVFALGGSLSGCDCNRGPFPPDATDYEQTYTLTESAATVSTAFTARLTRQAGVQTIEYRLTDSQFFARLEDRPSVQFPAYYNANCSVNTSNSHATCSFVINRAAFREARCGFDSFDYHLEADIAYTNSGSGEGETEFESPVLAIRSASPASGQPSVCDDDPPAVGGEDDDEDGDDEDGDGEEDADGDGADDGAVDTDADDDGIANGDDNCPNVSNSDQADADEDDLGDVCDEEDNSADDDGDDPADGDENCPLVGDIPERCLGLGARRGAIIDAPKLAEDKKGCEFATMGSLSPLGLVVISLGVVIRVVKRRKEQQ